MRNFQHIFSSLDHCIHQDIRLISLSLDYIQMSSGHSPEAWRPPEPRRPLISVSVSDDEDEPTQLEMQVKTEDAGDDQQPFFLYGERIWERKRRRIQRPMSAVPSRRTGVMDNTLSSLTSDDAGSSIASHSQRPKSSPGKQQALLGVSELGRLYRYPSRDSSSADGGSLPADPDGTFITRAVSTANSVVGGETRGSDDLPVVAWGPCDDDPSIVLSTGLSRASTPRGRVTPHQDWEDDTSHVTQKILKSQALAQMGKQQSLYLAPSDVMTSAAARNVRGLARQIRVSASGAVPDRTESRRHGATPLATIPDFPPTRPAHHTQDGFNRRASVGEILSQRRPTLSAGAWKSHLGQTSDTPMSLAARRQKVMETKKQWTETRNQVITEKVKDFVTSNNSRQLRPRTVCR